LAGVEPGYTPLPFFLARSKDRLVVAELGGIYIVLSIFLSLVVFVGYGRTYSFTDALTMLGLSGGILAVMVLILSNAIDRYTPARYQKTYFGKYKASHSGMTDDEIQDMLGSFYTTLRDRTKNVLKVDIGATLTAVSTILSLIGIIAKGM
jgi:drug/metabolite transporter superfamily protein YnfA